MEKVGCGLIATLVILSSSAASEIDQAVFQYVNSSVYNTHAPLIETKFNRQLIILELWQDYGGAFKKDSVRKPFGQNEFIVTLTGDIPQNRFMEQDGYAIVACHELGHILSEGPYQTPGLVKWSSVEGQADYYATNECMWRYIREDMSNDTKTRDFDQDLRAQCENVHRDATDASICLRIISGIIALQNYFNDTSSKDDPVDLRRKDLTQVEITLEKYPSNQCRIDTLMAGVLNQPRPSCWFAP